MSFPSSCFVVVQGKVDSALHFSNLFAFFFTFLVPVIKDSVRSVN